MLHLQLVNTYIDVNFFFVIEYGLIHDEFATWPILFYAQRFLKSAESDSLLCDFKRLLYPKGISHINSIYRDISIIKITYP